MLSDTAIRDADYIALVDSKRGWRCVLYRQHHPEIKAAALEIEVDSSRKDVVDSWRKRVQRIKYPAGFFGPPAN